MNPISRRLEEVRAGIAEACSRAGRPHDSVALVAVAKGFPASAVRELFSCGQILFGENRIQEALPKIEEAGPGPVWHFVGHLQRNKARRAVGRFELIHSVDDLELARELHRRAKAAGVVQPILVQVKVSSEPTKSGVAEEDLFPLLDGIVPLDGLELRGLMTLPPPPVHPEDSRPYFARLRRLRERAEGRLGRALPELSMGMSDDFQVAIEEGATIVRIGRALFGARPPAGRASEAEPLLRRVSPGERLRR
jgi:hypothetical protein